MDARVFGYRDWVKATPQRSLEQMRRITILGFVMTGVCGLLALLCLVVLLNIQPLQLQLLAGVVILSAAAVMTFRRADANRRNLARADGEAVSLQGEYALSVGDAEIHFPESFDDPEETWPLAETVAEIKTIAHKEIVALSHPGRTPRHFFNGALVDPVSEVKAEIEARQSVS